ncbi:MAG: oxidoreductase [Acidobacteria bacterium]|nr:MAG: oxidoreductase [Acidobacteriota bacterium]
MKGLTGRVVLITGASSGIGYSAALAFAEKKCKVAVCARREDRLRELSTKIETKNGECLYRIVDVAEQAQVHEFTREVRRRWGRVDIVVANAGYGYLANVEEIEAQEMERIWKVNFMGTLYSIQAAIPYMKEQGAGHIVITSSVVGRYSLPMSSAYCATKFAQVALGQALRVELKQSHIGVTMVYPGYTSTEFGEAQLNPKKRSRNQSRRGQHPDEVASAIVKAVLKNKKEIYPNLQGSVFAHAGLYTPWLLDEALAIAIKRYGRI